MSYELHERDNYDIFAKKDKGPKPTDTIYYLNYGFKVTQWRKLMKIENEKRRRHVIYERSGGFWICVEKRLFRETKAIAEIEKKARKGGDRRFPADIAKKDERSGLFKRVMIEIVNEEIADCSINWSQKLLVEIERRCAPFRNGKDHKKMHITIDVLKKWWSDSETEDWFCGLGGSLSQFVICVKMRCIAPDDLKERMDPRSKFDSDGLIIKGKYNWAEYGWPDDDKEKEEAENRG